MDRAMDVDERGLQLRAGALRAAVRPDVGGSLSGFWQERAGGPRCVLRAAPADASRPLQMASFPLVPWCNRIADCGFEWRGRRVRLAPNHPGEPLPLHGYGWYAHWRVTGLAESVVELAWTYGGGEWPWRFEATQRYALDGAGLTVELRVTNHGADAMPVGLGHHPYFPRTPATRLRAQLPTLIETDARLVPVARVANPLASRFSAGCTLADLRLDNGYTGWDAHATIEQPADGLRVEMRGEPGHAFHLYVPDEPYFCAEAVTNEPDAIHREDAEAAMRALAPGASAGYRLRLDVHSLAAAATQTSTVPS